MEPENSILGKSFREEIVFLTMDTRSSAMLSPTHAPSHPHRGGMSRPLAVAGEPLAVSKKMPSGCCSCYSDCCCLG